MSLSVLISSTSPQKHESWSESCFIQIWLTASVWEMLCDFKNAEVGVQSSFEGIPKKTELLCTPVMVIWVKNYKEIWKKEPLSHVLSCQAYACDVMWCMWCHIQSIEYIRVYRANHTHAHIWYKHNDNRYEWYMNKKWICKKPRPL